MNWTSRRHEHGQVDEAARIPDRSGHGRRRLPLFWPDDGKDDSYTVTAYFEKGIGLFPNSDVNILGVPVGKIKTVEPVGHTVKVTMEVSSDYKIPADATAQIVPISLISDRYVEFAPAYTEGPVLQDGAVIPQERTVIPAELDDVFKQLKKLLDAIQPGGPGEPGALGELIVELDKTFRGKEDDLQGALTEGAQVTRTLASTSDDLQGVLANLDSLFGTLSTRSGEFDTLNKNLITVLTAITESRDDLEGTLVNIGDLVRRGRGSGTGAGRGARGRPRTRRPHREGRPEERAVGTAVAVVAPGPRIRSRERLQPGVEGRQRARQRHRQGRV